MPDDLAPSPYQAGVKALAAYLDGDDVTVWNDTTHSVQKLYLQPAVFGRSTIAQAAARFQTDVRLGKLPVRAESPTDKEPA
jgi:hypothetical protein